MAIWTGDLGWLGPDLSKGMQTALHDINGSGGIDGRTVEEVHADSQGTAEGAISAVDQLLQADRVSGMVGPTSTTIMSVLNRIQASKVPDMINAGLPTLDGMIKGKTTFRVTPSDTLTGPAMAEYAYQKGYRTCDVLTSADEGAVAVGKAVATSFEGLGGTIKETITLASSQPSYQPEALKLYTPPLPQCIFTEVEAETGGAFWQNASQFKNVGQPAYVATESLQSSDILKSMAPVAKDVRAIAISPGSTGPGASEFVKQYRATYPKEKEPAVLTNFIYDATEILALAMDEAHSSDPSVYVSHIRSVSSGGQACTSFHQCSALIAKGVNINYQGASGDCDIQPDGNTLTGFRVYKELPGPEASIGRISQADVKVALAKLNGS